MLNRTSSSKKSTVTKELEDLMESLSGFTPPSQSSTRIPTRSPSSSEKQSTKKISPIPSQHPICHSCEKPIIGQVLNFLK